MIEINKPKIFKKLDEITTNFGELINDIEDFSYEEFTKNIEEYEENCDTSDAPEGWDRNYKFDYRTQEMHKEIVEESEQYLEELKEIEDLLNKAHKKLFEFWKEFK